MDAAAEARGKWDLALQQEQSKRGTSPRRLNSASGLTLPVSSAIPATSSPVAVHSVSTVAATKAQPLILATAAHNGKDEEEEAVKRYDKSRQSPPISLSTTVSEKVAKR
jgi:hypothetical protein